MLEYTQSIETQIAEVLRLRGRIAADGIPGIPDDDAHRFLGYFWEGHAGEQGLSFDGAVLTLKPEPHVAQQPVAPPVVTGSPSPVDQVLTVAPGRSVLDSATLGTPVSKWLWALPLTLGVLGGGIAWLIAKDSNARAARNLLIAGIAVQLLIVCSSMGLGALVGSNPAFRSTMQSSGGRSVDWPISASGRPVFYYFGTST